ncbi:PLD nuclease N-terminal domain-containing protein [Cryobacterium sp. M91]|uniref:PLD nuclease N-terminal domain-containing protein n=1 Tax=Cryobacterium sp. M91 TaxID=2048294 RepID=UPI001E47474D|nr:PLD nuclease N-terminal domain-containing protein [Cryobacterium sp. M91]
MSVLLVVLVIVALVSIGRAAKRLTPTQALIWTLLTIFVPVVGPVAWLSIGRRSGPTPVRSHAD